MSGSPVASPASGIRLSCINNLTHESASKSVFKANEGENEQEHIMTGCTETLFNSS